MRAKKSQKIVDAFFQWCETQAELALDGSPIAKALNYARNQETGLRRFLTDGRLPLGTTLVSGQGMARLGTRHPILRQHSHEATS